MKRKQINAQGEIQLLSEWLAALPRTYSWKTHVHVGEQPLAYLGAQLTPAQQRAFGVWSDWADARVWTGGEVWIVEAKLVATGSAYGQLIDYLDEYPSSADYAVFAPAPVKGVVLAQAARPRTSTLFAARGIETVIYQPSWPVREALQKVFPAAQILQPGVSGEGEIAG